MIPVGTRRKLDLYFFILRFSAVTGALIGAIIGTTVLDPPLFGATIVAIIGAMNTIMIAALIGGAEVFGPQTRVGRALEAAPFLTIYFLKLFVYGAVMMAVVASRLGERLLNGLVIDPFFVGSELWRSINPHLKADLPPQVQLAYGIPLLLFFILLIQLSRLVGERSFRDIAFGRYHRPRIEQRFFLFIDIVGSTPLAERLGPAPVYRFLNRVFQIASDQVDHYGGEVYQYVGDEVVATWTLAEGRTAARPIACYFAIERAIRSAASEFERDFDAVPHLRAALHAGPVITGEVGGSRRVIVFHGDVMNTTSRLENATRELQRSFLVSEDALSCVENKDSYTTMDLGPQMLRGRAAPVRVYAVEPAAEVPEAMAQTGPVG